MRRSASVWFSGAWAALFLGSLPLAAQYAVPVQNSFGAVSGLQSGQGSTPQSVTVLTSPPQTSGCPVSLRAQHLADGGIMRARDPNLKSVGQWLHLTVANPQEKKVRAALITVHGFADKTRVTQTGRGNTPDASRTVTVSFSAAAGQAAEADVWVPGITAVALIELKQVTYADGSLWSLAGGGSCRITPDPLMLIAGR